LQHLRWVHLCAGTGVLRVRRRLQHCSRPRSDGICRSRARHVRARDFIQVCGLRWRLQHRFSKARSDVYRLLRIAPLPFAFTLAAVVALDARPNRLLRWCSLLGDLVESDEERLLLPRNRRRLQHTATHVSSHTATYTTAYTTANTSTYTPAHTATLTTTNTAISVRAC